MYKNRIISAKKMLNWWIVANIVLALGKLKGDKRVIWSDDVGA